MSVVTKSDGYKDHTDTLLKGYDVLSKELLDVVLKKWPELEPESIET